MIPFPFGYLPLGDQEKIIKEILEAYRAGFKFVLLQAPPGSGKSHICMACAIACRDVGRSAFYLTLQKYHQDQLKDLFKDEVAVMKGRVSYPCLHNSGVGLTCDKAPCKQRGKGIISECIPGYNDNSVQGDSELANRMMGKALVFEACHGEVDCSYFLAGFEAKRHPITVMNFESFLYQFMAGRFFPRELMILDEAHSIESKVMSFTSVTIHDDVLTSMGIHIDKKIKTAGDFHAWVIENRVIGRLEYVIKAMEDGGGDPKALEKHKSVKSRLEFFMKRMTETEWVVEVTVSETKNGQTTKVNARPVFGAPYANGLLFSRAKKVLAVSATILDKDAWAESVGLDPKEVYYISKDCDFPVQNRPIHLVYAGNMSKDHFWKVGGVFSSTRPKMMTGIKAILKLHKDHRGVIHAQSHKLAAAIVDDVKDPRLIVFDEEIDEDKTEFLKRHMERRPDSVIVSPGLYEGADLVGDMSRFQIIAKVPFADMGDKVVFRRMQSDPHWYQLATLVKFIQSCGRSVRSMDDWAYTYVLDSTFERMSDSPLIPEWFKRAYVRGMPKSVRTV
jgi:Rad3-related DNA helicase